MRHPFDVDTAVAAAGDGLFNATLTDRWNRLLGGPLGGYQIAVCLQALRQTMPFPDPLVFSAFFLRPAQVGPAEVRTTTVRTGRRMATGEASLVQEGKEGVRLLATFTDLGEATGRTEELGTPPDLPSPEDAIDPLAGLSIDGVSIAERLEYRVATPPGWLRGQPSGRPSADVWVRLKGGREPDLPTLALLVDALPLAILELGEPGSTTLELTAHLRARPAPGWLACHNETRHVDDGMHEEDVEVWDSRGRLVAQARQLAVLASHG